jgi:ribonuclease HI
MLDPHALKIFIDGSALENPGGSGGIAGIVQYPDSWGRSDEQVFEIGYRETTNNRMELRALLTALQYLRKNSDSLPIQRVQIVTDSLYVNENYRRADGWRHNGWKNVAGKPVENSDLWKEFLSLWGKPKIRVDIVWRKGKKSLVLKQVDKAAKKAASQPWEADRGFRAGKVGRSKSGRGTASSLYPAQGQESVIRVYRSGIVGRAAHKVTFEEYDEQRKSFGNKFSAFAATAALAVDLHRGHCYRVRFNGEPRNPQILEVIEADLQL